MTRTFSTERLESPMCTLSVPLAELEERLAMAIEGGARLGLLTARRSAAGQGFALLTLVIEPARQSVALWESPLVASDRAFPTLTPRVPQAHWFERALFDLFGLRPEGHPHFKSLLLHEAWPEGFHPLRAADSMPDESRARRTYRFMTVKGEGVYEIPVGPIHAGIIEPGHFRFSCLGEVIHNLEIRLGYQHRGVERRLEELPWRKARFLAEAASSDTAVGNGLAHALAIERIFGVEPSAAARSLRAVALEIERAASHLSDLGGICSDIGFTGGAAIFGKLRGRALGLGQRLTGTRLQTAYVLPGGVARGLSEELRRELLLESEILATELVDAEPLLLDNTGALQRMQGVGHVRPSLARDFGLVGPAGRASGVDYDVRRDLGQEPYRSCEWTPSGSVEGDALARVQARAGETRTSLELIRHLLSEPLDQNDLRVSLPDRLPSSCVGVGIVEAWRGELVHLICTDGAGGIARYAVKDPSFNNWTGLAIAARNALVADFPLCNKSFGLSYSGNDL